MPRHGFVFFILIIIAVTTSPVRAHANLQRSEPSANEQLDEAPREIRLFFTEPIEPQFSHIELHNSLGETLDLPGTQVDPEDNTQLVLIPGNLADGIYTVIWRVVSQTDGHFTQGSFPIIIGTGNFTSEGLRSVEDSGIPWLSGGIRWLNLFSMAWLVGGVAFWLFIWQPSVQDTYPELEKRLRDVNWMTWQGVGLSTVLILLLQAQIVSGGGGLDVVNTITQIINGTRFGGLWIIRGILWIVFGLLLWRGKQRSRNVNTILLVIAAGILVTQSLFSHASGTEDTVPSVLADWMHILAVAIWIGGLIQFTLVIGTIRETNRLSVMVARFSNMARVCVALLIITGFYAAWLQVGSLDALLTTPYGQTLFVKLGLFLPLLAIAAINLIFTYRGLRSGNAIWSKRLRLLVIVEIVLSIAILFATGIMTAIAPARNTAAARDFANAPPPISDNTFFEMIYDDDLMIHFNIEPGLLGENTFTVDLYDAEIGNEINDATLIRLRFENEEQDIGESELRIESQTDGRYIVIGANLSSLGTWRIRMTVQRPNEFDSVVDFEPTISLPVPAPPPFDPAPPAESRSFALILTGMIGVGMCAIFVMYIRPTALNPQTILTVIFAAGSLFLLQSGIQLRSGDTLINPIPVSEDSLALGETLFMSNCSQCHGVTGLGDGPVAASLNPPPANLAIHTAPGLHTDTELFTWISNGVSSTSAMPAFNAVLTVEERWHLVNFIRTFGQQAQP